MIGNIVFSEQMHSTSEKSAQIRKTLGKKFFWANGPILNKIMSSIMAPLTYSAKVPHVLNLSNGIIGVSILAMPFCMKQCGLIFGTLVLFGTSILTRLSCDLLMKGAYFARTNSYESYALQTYGKLGKMAVEICLILYSKGTLIAFFVVIGDLGPMILSDFLGVWTGVADRETIRTVFMALVAFLIILPLSMLDSLGSLSRISSLAILFYGFLVVRIVMESLPTLFSTGWWRQVNWWEPSGFFQTLPIFALSLSCQTQLFVVASEIPECSPTKMDNVVNSALNLCSSIYLLVGTFGYVAFRDQPIGGDVLVLLDSNVVTKFIKAGFLLSVAVSYPIMIFPCRVAVYSMIVKPNTVSLIGGDLVGDYMHPTALKIITVFLIGFNFMVALWVPDVEMILALCGSLIGSLICFVFPGLLFIRVCPKKEIVFRFLAKVCTAIGILTLLFSTYATFREPEAPVKASEPILNIPDNAPSPNAPIMHPVLKEDVLPVEKDPVGIPDRPAVVPQNPSPSVQPGPALGPGPAPGPVPPQQEQVEKRQVGEIHSNDKNAIVGQTPAVNGPQPLLKSKENRAVPLSNGSKNLSGSKINVSKGNGKNVRDI